MSRLLIDGGLDGLHRRRIALTGGPGGGKTTAGDLLRRELAPEVILVPEAATLLFSGGFPRYDDTDARRAAQLAIFHVQRNLEEVQAAAYPERILLCDRGTVDGAAYWPGPPEEFFDRAGTSLEVELARYDAVLFFESAAVGGLSIEGGNPVRTEQSAEAAAIDARLRAIWSHHPCTEVIPHDRSFFAKIREGLEAFERLVDRLRPAAPGSRAQA